MAKTKIKNLSIEGAKLVFRNFSGEEKAFNQKGKRNFCVLIDPAVAPDLVAEGWNIKELKPKEEGDLPQPYLQVSVNFENVPPKIVMITSRGQTILSEDKVDSLDWAEIETADVIITPYVWNINSKTGVKAYLKTLYVTIVEDEFEKKYANFNEEG